MAQSNRSHIAFGIGLVWMLLASTSVLAQETPMYRFEIGAQAGAAYYMGELAPHPFMSTSETYGLQFRAKINDRWAVQAKAQSQRFIHTFQPDNQWNIPAAKYQTPMWHCDVTGEYNFFHYGYNAYDIRVRNFTPYIFLGFGVSFLNHDATNHEGYAFLGKERQVKPDTIYYERAQTRAALYVPVGVGFKWRFAPRWQLQLAWQHNLYIHNGDCLEGETTPRAQDNQQEGPYNLFNNSHNMNGANIFNNDVASTFTIGVAFEFMQDPGICLICR
ncbi:MAG: outer membrane beta-barrel protein [Paludibacteraceae bacterium]|nr:outer membrane beta-barrel protein [Paludibacteraceae bacterium]